MNPDISGWSAEDAVNATATVERLMLDLAGVITGRLILGHEVASPEREATINHFIGELTTMTFEELGLREKIGYTLNSIVTSAREYIDMIESGLEESGLSTQALPDPDGVEIPDTVPLDWD